MDTPPAKLTRGIIQRLKEGRDDALVVKTKNPAARLTARPGSRPAAGHRPIQAIAASTPNAATAPGSLASSGSETAPQSVSLPPRLPSPRGNGRLSSAFPLIAAAISVFVSADE